MYFDPGFGGMLVQIIVAVIAVGGGLLFSFRKKIRKFFSKDKNEPIEFTATNEAEDDAVDVLDNEG